MEHRIKVKIADRIYPQIIHSEDEEEAIRSAAQSINERIDSLRSSYPGATMVDLLTIAAVNEGLERFVLQRRLDELEAGYEKLSADLQNYVDSLK